MSPAPPRALTGPGTKGRAAIKGNSLGVSGLLKAIAAEESPSGGGRARPFHSATPSLRKPPPPRTKALPFPAQREESPKGKASGGGSKHADVHSGKDGHSRRKPAKIIYRVRQTKLNTSRTPSKQHAISITPAVIINIPRAFLSLPCLIFSLSLRLSLYLFLLLSLLSPCTESIHITQQAPPAVCPDAAGATSPFARPTVTDSLRQTP